MEKISWTDRVRNEEVLHRVKEERNILDTMKRWKAKWIGHILPRIEVKGRQGRRCKQIFDDLKERGRYWELKEEAPDRTVWRTGFGRGCGPVVRQTAKSVNEYVKT